MLPSRKSPAMESAKSLQLLELRARAGLWSLSADGQELWWSEGIYRILGVEPTGYRPELSVGVIWLLKEKPAVSTSI